MIDIPSNVKAVLAERYMHSAKTGISAENALVHIFNPYGAGDWFVSEAGPINADGEICDPEEAIDWHLFGFACLSDPMAAEYGYTMLSELQSVRIRIGNLGEVSLEVDRNFKPTPLKQICRTLKSSG